VIALTPGKDDVLIAALNEFATGHRGGVVKISAAEYAEKKSLYPFRGSQAIRPGMLQLNQSAARPIFKQAPAVPPTPNPGVPAAAGDRGFVPLEHPQPIVPPPQPAPVAPGSVEAPPAELSSAKSTFKPTTARASQKVKPVPAAAE